MEIEEKNAVKVKVHWGKLKLDFALDKSDDLDTVKEKQKILYKGKVIKEDSQLKAMDIPEGATVMLMGSAEGKGMDIENIQQKMFIEELTPEQRAKFYKETMGVLLKIPELRKAIEETKSMESIGESSSLVKALANVFRQLEVSGDTVKPMSFIQFAEQDKHGGFQQQDADECFQGILSTAEPALAGNSGSLIDKLFSFTVRYTWTNTECPDEPAFDTYETLRRMPCIIDNQSMPINQLHEGISVALEGDVEKRSDVMERDCVYHKTGKIATLPEYLIVQKIRFIWKEKDQGTLAEARKAKILRCVNFPRVLNMDLFCVPELQTQFKEIREKVKLADEEKHKQVEAEFEAYKKLHEKSEMDTMKLNKNFKEGRREADIKEHEDQLWHDLETGRPTGDYELVGVITHKGRSADSGHYVGWTHFKGDDWYRFDDDLVSKVKIEDILALRGGGDWHMAYYLIYRRIQTDL